MQKVVRPRAVSLAAGYFAFVGLATIIFWVLFFTTDWLHLSDWECYLVFERSFPLADSWLALTCFLAVAGLWRGRASGWLFALLASSAAIFLALLDLLYSLENDVFWPFTFDSISELTLIIVLLVPAAIIIPWLWRRRELFLR